MISGHLATCSHGEQEEEIGLSWTNGSYDIKSTSFAVLQQWEMCKTCLSQLLSNLCLPLRNSGCEWPLIFFLKPWKTCQNSKQQSSDSNCITFEYRFNIVQLHHPAQYHNLVSIHQMCEALPQSLKNIQTYNRQRVMYWIHNLDRRSKCACSVKGTLCEMRGTKETGSGLLLATLGSLSWNWAYTEPMACLNSYETHTHSDKFDTSVVKTLLVWLLGNTHHTPILRFCNNTGIFCNFNINFSL